MQVRDRHHRVGPGVHRQPKAALADPLLPRDGLRDAHQVAHRRIVPRFEVVDRSHVLVRHDQHVHGGLRLDVAEGGYVLVLVDDVGRDGAADDAAEEAVVHASSPSAISP